MQKRCVLHRFQWEDKVSAVISGVRAQPETKEGCIEASLRPLSDKPRTINVELVSIFQPKIQHLLFAFQRYCL